MWRGWAITLSAEPGSGGRAGGLRLRLRLGLSSSTISYRISASASCRGVPGASTASRLRAFLTLPYPSLPFPLPSSLHPVPVPRSPALPASAASYVPASPDLVSLSPRHALEQAPRRPIRLDSPCLSAATVVGRVPIVSGSLFARARALRLSADLGATRPPGRPRRFWP